MYKIAVFVSGRGSNLKAVFNALTHKNGKAEIVAVVSDKIDCPAFEFAVRNNLQTFSVAANKKNNILSYSELLTKLKQLNTDLIVLAGFLKKIPEILIENFENKIINIHPALLPAFGGKGMYGMNVHKAVFKKSAQLSGPTIHFVDKIYDNGKIIAQECVDISDVKTPEEIAERVLKIEHKILPEVILKFAENKVIEKNGRIYLLK
jgi:formyltetrahydrofolate-dependent phosphoribosylglycinamide formyltransferase